MGISDAEFAAATKAGREARATHSGATAVRYDARRRELIITLKSGLSLAFSPRLAQELKDARPADLREAVISPSGLGIHFPRIDADIHIPGLLAGALGSATWMAELAKAGGSTRSKAKAAAARENGRRGGRPRKDGTTKRHPASA